MRQHGWLLVGLAGATLGLTLALTLSSGQHRTALAIYVLVVAGLVLATLARAVRQTLPPAPRSLFDPPREREEPRPPVQLADVERRLAAARSSEFQFEARLRPLLFQAAAVRAHRRGVDVERRPDALRELVGDEAWQLLRPDRRSERLAARRRDGIPDEKLAMIIERVEWI